MRILLILLLLLIQIGCDQSIDNTPYYNVDASLEMHLDSFIEEMNTRGIEITIPDQFSIQFDSTIPNQRAVTRHNKNKTDVLVSTYYQDKAQSPITELVLYHELSHGLLKLSHHPLESHIMYYQLTPKYYFQNKKQRLDELALFYTGQ